MNESRACRWRRLAEVPLKLQLKAPEFYAIMIIFALNILAEQSWFAVAPEYLNKLGDKIATYRRVLTWVVAGALLSTLCCDLASVICTVAEASE